MARRAFSPSDPGDHGRAFDYGHGFHAHGCARWLRNVDRAAELLISAVANAPSPAVAIKPADRLPQVAILSDKLLSA
jgi:hypothetical protein